MASRGNADEPVEEGVRERKQRETRLRIAQTGLQLFLARGYEGTTLDAIAEAAGISRRTFFSYFKSKDEVILAWQAAAWDTMCDELRQVSPDETPLDAVRDTLVKQASRYESSQLIAIDRLIRSSETLMARKQAAYVAQEVALHETLCEIWRQPERRPALRVIAMMSVGAMRLGVEAWASQKGNGKRPASAFLKDAFEALKAAR